MLSLDNWALDLLFEFSIEYDINAIRTSYREKRQKENAKKRPDNESMVALGYSELELD